MKDLADYFYCCDDTEANKLTMKLIPMFTKVCQITQQGAPHNINCLARRIRTLLIYLYQRELSHYIQQKFCDLINLVCFR